MASVSFQKFALVLNMLLIYLFLLIESKEIRRKCTLLKILFYKLTNFVEPNLNRNTIQAQNINIQRNQVPT